jgi:hypothetical protein
MLMQVGELGKSSKLRRGGGDLMGRSATKIDSDRLTSHPQTPD